MKSSDRKSRLNALLSLLDDPDLLVYEAVERELLKASSSIVPELEIQWEKSYNEEVQSRLENLIQRIHFEANYKQLRKWARLDQPDLLDGFILATKNQFADLNEERMHRKIDDICRKVWVELSNSLTALEKVTVLNHVFFNDFKFSADTINYYSPQYCFLNKILETGTGNPLSIALLYAIVANRLELPVRYVDIPQYPLLAYVDHKVALKVHRHEIKTDVLFYIFPGKEGSITGRRELEFHLRKMNFDLHDRYFEASTPQTFIRRLLEMTEKSYEINGFTDKRESINHMIRMLKPNRSK